MSAPAPAPPPHLTPSFPLPDGPRKSPSPARTIPHIQDLIAKAEGQVDYRASITKLLERAGTAIKQSRSLLDFQRLDYAFVEHIVANSIVSTAIPRHKDWPTLQVNNGRLHAIYRDLMKGVHQDGPRFKKVQELIKQDNEQNETQPISATIVRAPNEPIESIASTSGRQTPNTTSHYSGYRPSSMVVSSNSTARHRQSTSLSSPYRNSLIEPDLMLSSSSKTRPPVIHPKPKSLHGMAITSNGLRKNSESASINGDSLNERFRRLRVQTQPMNGNDNQPSFDNDVRSPPDSVRLRAPISKYHRDTLSNSLQTGFSKDLPKPPSPAYSPARTMKGETAMETEPNDRNGILNATDSISSFSLRSFNTYDHAVERFPNAQGHSATQSASPGILAQPAYKPSNPSSVPQETEISAEQLYDYLKTFNVLLIDVRSREEYDAGHIFTQTSICIEPTALRRNQSAEELFESLVLSPENEQILFDGRSEFDLVVYHDQSSVSANPSASQGPKNVALQFLHDTLYDYNQEKPLSFPPVLLIGGIEAWVALCGVHALKTSETAAHAKAAKKSARPLARKSLAKESLQPNMQVQKKRHRDYNPLAPEEERKWRERARSESHVLDANSQVLPSEDEVHGNRFDERPPFLKNYEEDYEEFQHRYPDAPTIEHNRLMNIGPPARPPPPEPARMVPTYPTPPVPTVPSRPPPAVPRPSYSGISERKQAQQISSARPPQLAPYIPQKLKRLPRIGLHNFGVTCYMNATIQCLSATIPLTAFFLDNQYIKYIQKDNWKGSKGIMSELYNILLRNLWEAHDVDTIRPTNFRKFCARLNKEWGIDRQQDAKEFLEFLIDCLHEDLNINWARSILRPLTAKEEAERERTPPFIASKREWDRYEHRDHSRLTDLFAGQHISRLQCTTCRQSSTTYEAFYSISVEIPKVSSNRPLNIHDCLRSYCSAETLSGDEVWRCPHCQKEREATKRITITRAPEFLVIHFKRFSASHSERARKVHTPVDFPLEGLDLEPYMLPPPESDPTVAEHITARFGEQELRDKPASMRPPYKYSAYAVMRHLGATMTAGHYIALVKDRARGVWREFNDDRVNDFRPEDLDRSRRLQNETAYIVFYQRMYE